MQDKVLTSLLLVPVAIIVLLISTMVLLEYTDQEPRSSIGSIPKVLFDYVDNATLVTVVSVGDYRYDAIYINYTVGNQTFNNSALGRYAMDANVTATLFTLNVTAVLGTDHYMLNCTVSVDVTSSSPKYIWTTEEDNPNAARHRVPFTLLAEWRDLP